MKSEVLVDLCVGEFICKSFTNVDPDYGGVEVFRDGERLGSIVDLIIPDEDDKDEVEAFEKEVEDWVIDNEH